jgi:hypothetical protein
MISQTKRIKGDISLFAVVSFFLERHRAPQHGPYGLMIKRLGDSFFCIRLPLQSASGTNDLALAPSTEPGVGSQTLRLRLHEPFHQLRIKTRFRRKK